MLSTGTNILLSESFALRSHPSSIILDDKEPFFKVSPKIRSRGALRCRHVIGFE